MYWFFLCSNRGGDLLQRINESPMSEPESVVILQQILEALNYMHGNDFMHLDVKVDTCYDDKY